MHGAGRCDKARYSKPVNGEGIIIRRGIPSGGREKKADRCSDR